MLCRLQFVFAIFLLAALRPSAEAGLHYTGEQWADLPAQWRGFLLDQRALRTLAIPPGPGMPVSSLRDSYQAERDRLERLTRPLTADEKADLGALLVRFGESDKAMTLLREATRQHPDHFRCAANLGTACQLGGDLPQAVAALEVAVALAPPKWKKFEQLHLKLVRQRRAEPRNTESLDDLFGVKFSENDRSMPELPTDAISLTQMLALWLPADGRLIWQLGELAQATGDSANAAAMLEGAVTEFGLNDPVLRQRRVSYRQQAEQAVKNPPAGKADQQSVHAAHGGGGMIRFKSPRPLIRQANALKLPAINPTGLNHLPWAVLAETALDRPFKVTFHEHLKQLDGKRVVLTGFLQPTGDSIDQIAVLLIEYPVGCWFCEVPEPTGIVLVEPPADKTIRLTRENVRVEGVLKLNSSDPEEFLYTITEAKVGPPD
jgi:hypothetical protein